MTKQLSFIPLSIRTRTRLHEIFSRLTEKLLANIDILSDSKLNIWSLFIVAQTTRRLTSSPEIKAEKVIGDGLITSVAHFLSNCVQ